MKPFETPPLNPCRCGAKPNAVILEHYRDDFPREDVTVYRCPKCGDSHKGADAWNAANPPAPVVKRPGTFVCEIPVGAHVAILGKWIVVASPGAPPFLIDRETGERSDIASLVDIAP